VDPAELARQVIAACFAEPQLLPEQRLAEAVEEVRRRYEVPWYARAYLGSMRSLISSFVRAYLPGAGSMWRDRGQDHRADAGHLGAAGSHRGHPVRADARAGSSPTAGCSCSTASATWPRWSNLDGRPAFVSRTARSRG
jgi:hypothetical protein